MTEFRRFSKSVPPSASAGPVGTGPSALPGDRPLIVPPEALLQGHGIHRDDIDTTIH